MTNFSYIKENSFLITKHIKIKYIKEKEIIISGIAGPVIKQIGIKENEM